jgi:hypothetical protein
MNLLGFLGSVFIPRPWLALGPGLLFGLFYVVIRRRFLVITAAVWVAYAVYEYTLYRRWLCSGECDIRVDLLLIYPVLLLISVAALVLLVVSLLRRRRYPIRTP